MVRPESHFEEIAILRALAFLAVVLQHVVATVPMVSPAFREDLLPTTVLLIVTRFAVPAFVFIAGFLAMGSLARTPTPSFLRRRARTVVLPYLVWSTIYYVYWKLVHGHPLFPSPTLAEEFFFTLLRGSAQYHLWFIIMIIQMYLLAPVLVPLVRRCGSVPRSVGLLAVVVVAHVGVLWIYPEPLVDPLAEFSIFRSLSKLRYQLFPLWLIYAVVGMLTALHHERLKHHLASQAGIWVMLAFAIYSGGLALRLATMIDAQTTYRMAADASELFVGPMVPYVVLTIAAGAAFAYRVGAHAARLSDWLVAISARSYVGYLAHPLAIAALTWRGDGEMLDWSANPLLIALLLFVGATTLTVAASLAFERLPRALRIGLTGR